MVSNIDDEYNKQLNQDYEFSDELNDSDLNILLNNTSNNNSVKNLDFLNYDNISTIIYPTNLPIRDYQFDIVQKALFENIICAIPTGLGKTFIASTIMLNFFNWTTNKMKIIFMAPTKPLVAQQIKAFIQITGISMNYTDILLDKSKKNRNLIWENKRILFTTPQVVENDLKSGILNPKEIVCLILDEAHRATGNYAYVNVIKFINRFNSNFRILALTATPGSEIENIQTIINNLNISSIEIKKESDPEIAKYIKNKLIEKLDCEQTIEINLIVEMISDAIKPILKKANDFKIYEITDPSKINNFVAMEKSRKIVVSNLSENIKWSYFFILQLLGTVGMFYRRLNIYGIKCFYNYFLNKYNEFTTKYNMKKSTNKLAAQFFYHERIKNLKLYIEDLFQKDLKNIENNKNHIEGLFSHSKFKYLCDELIYFFRSSKNNLNSSCIIFTELRESALEIVKILENVNKSLNEELIKPHIFIGQSKEKDKFDQDKYFNKHATKRQKLEKKDKNNNTSNYNINKENDKETNSERLNSSEDAQLKGMNQKKQKELIEDFKNGVFNVLVATSIGEEGLDIGEVDLIICFDSTQSPIKNIQRMGRTGRKRDGKVILLFSSNERSKFESSMNRYEWIQNQIVSGNDLNFHKNDNNRMLPKNIKPIIEKKLIEIPKENIDLLKNSDLIDNTEFIKLATQTIKLQPKKIEIFNENKKIQKKFYLPDNVELGFKSVSNLVKTDKSKLDMTKKVKKKDNNNRNGCETSSIVDLFSSLAGLPKGKKDDDDNDINNNNSSSIRNSNSKIDTSDIIDLTVDSDEDDQLSDISFTELERNIIVKNSFEGNNMDKTLDKDNNTIKNNREEQKKRVKRKFCEYSDFFDDDDDLLIAELDRLQKLETGNVQARPAKR